MARFSSGSSAVKDGKLRGRTDQSEHFFFLCPRCPNDLITQILDYEVARDGPVEYNAQGRTKAKRDFKISFKIHCTECGLTDVVEISNDAWQGGRLQNAFG